MFSFSSPQPLPVQGGPVLDSRDFWALSSRDKFLSITLSQRPRSFRLFPTPLQTPLCLWLPNVDPGKVTSLDYIDFLDKWQIEHHDELFQKKKKETQKELQLKTAATDPCPTWRWYWVLS